MVAVSHALMPSGWGRPPPFRRGLPPRVPYRHRSMIRPPSRPRVVMSASWSTPLISPSPAYGPSLATSKSGGPSLRRDPDEFENFVTPREETPRKNSYEVTTKQFEDTEPESPAALTTDDDVPIAIDDEEDEDDGVEESVGWRRPDHRYPLVKTHYRHGAPHGRHRWFKKPTGRVRMQVFRGPNRKYGHRSYAQWGYYVVQPAGEGAPHHRHRPYKK